MSSLWSEFLVPVGGASRSTSSSVPAPPISFLPGLLFKTTVGGVSVIRSPSTARSSSKSVLRERQPTKAYPTFIKLPKGSRGGKIRPSRLCFRMEPEKLKEPKFEMVGQRDGVIIVDHGSRREESNLLLNEFATMFKRSTGYPIVELAHMELAEPSIREAFGSCVQQGATRVIISPFFLFPGRHWHQDIPSLADAAALEHPGVSYLVTAPLGLHKLLVDVVKDRIEYCLSHVAGQEDECVVCKGTGRCKLKMHGE